MLRIEANRRTDELIVTASGELTAKHLPELGRVISEAAAEGLAIVLDLEAVSFADRESISFLAHGEGRRARILGAPAYVEEWIRLENLPEKGETTMSKRNSLVAALVIAVSFVSFGCEHLRSKDLGKGDQPVEGQKVANAPVSLNPYGKN